MKKIVRIPFLERFRKPLLSGDKVCTARTKVYGKTGDFFTAFGATFCIVVVEKVKLETVAELYNWEGFKSMVEFIQCWVHLHPRRGFDRNQKVWLHLFKKV